MKRHVAVLAALGSGIAAAGVGCNLVVDSSGYSVRDAGVEAASFDAGPEASSDDSGGQQEGGEAGPVACGAGLPNGPDFQQLVKSCLLAVSCDPFFFSETLEFCITYDGLHSNDAYAACLAGIQTCDDFYTCQHVREATIADCPNTGPSATCKGLLAINCGDQGSGAVKDCSSLGGTRCSTYIDDTDTQVAECVVDPLCTDTDGLEHCTSNSLYTCVDGVGYGASCGSDLTCATVADSTDCYFNQPSCGVADSYACNGEALTFCSTGLQSFVDHCGVSGSKCDLTDAGIGYCVSPGCTTQSVENCSESCAADGTTLDTCVGGAPYAIDCTKYGFTACGQSKDDDTATPTTYTYCQ
jgi:hypothetical protein